MCVVLTYNYIVICNTDNDVTDIVVMYIGMEENDDCDLLIINANTH